jgi:hypothetical protein
MIRTNSCLRKTWFLKSQTEKKLSEEKKSEKNNDFDEKTFTKNMIEKYSSEKIKNIMEMGFSFKEAYYSLKKYENDPVL